MGRIVTDFLRGSALRVAALLCCVAAGSLAATGCSGRVLPSAQPTGAVRGNLPDSEFRAIRVLADPPPSILVLAAENSLIRPESVTGTVYAWTDNPRLAVTATLVTLDNETGALATYNGWLARYAFMPAVERFAADLGDRSERLELGWPPLHALICRAGRLFLLVEADGNLPAEVRTTALREVAGLTLAGRSTR